MRLREHGYIRLGAILLSLSLFIALPLPFDAGLKGNVVETHHIFWVSLVISAIYALRVHRKDYLSSLMAVFSLGLCLRMISATHALFSDYDPWRELASVHYIQKFGFDLRGNYYHSSLPVLHAFLLFLIPVFGEYNTITFFGPMAGWTASFLCLYKLGKEFLDPEHSLLALFVYSSANISLQSHTNPEIIALPIGLATVYFFHNNTVSSSFRNTAMVVLFFMLLNFTHHLTSFFIIVVTGAVAFYSNVKRREKYSIYLWMILLIIFLLYWQHYQRMLSDILLFEALPSFGEAITWPTHARPIWWLILYLTPKILTASLLAFWLSQMIVQRNMPNPIIMPMICLTGGFLLIAGLAFPVGLYPTRLFNQAYSYFSIGMSKIGKQSRIFMGILAATFMIGLVAEFPMTNMTDYYVGGYWLSHSTEEVLGARYLALNISSGSSIVIDGRCITLVEAFKPPDKDLKLIGGWTAFEAYNASTGKETWDYCIQKRINYVFVSMFYGVIAQFDVYGGARSFSKTQLTKFEPPYFTCIYQNDQVKIYEVNSQKS